MRLHLRPQSVVANRPFPLSRRSRINISAFRAGRPSGNWKALLLTPGPANVIQAQSPDAPLTSYERGHFQR